MALRATPSECSKRNVRVFRTLSPPSPAAPTLPPRYRRYQSDLGFQKIFDFNSLQDIAAKLKPKTIALQFACARALMKQRDCAFVL
jgi:hypothetical protein